MMRAFNFAQRGVLLLVGMITLLFLSSQFLAKSANDEFFAQNSVFKLGQFVEFDLAVKDVNAAQKFYESLGFKNTAAAQAGHPLAALTDGNVVLALRQTDFPSPTITYYGSNLSACLNALQANGVKPALLKNGNGKVVEMEFFDPDSQRILLKAQAPVSRPGVAFELMTPAGPQNQEKHYSKIGMFGEFSIAVKDRAASAAFWLKFGFKKFHESNSPYPWGIYSDSLTVLGLHQTTEFKEPALSFFSKDSKDRIIALKKEGFSFVADIDPTNSVLKSSDGQMIFVFNMP
jgi:predicted lactoylglutathione lyase